VREAEVVPTFDCRYRIVESNCSRYFAAVNRCNPVPRDCEVRAAATALCSFAACELNAMHMLALAVANECINAL
jgi:hypothetical protein